MQSSKDCAAAFPALSEKWNSLMTYMNLKMKWGDSLFQGMYVESKGLMPSKNFLLGIKI